MAAPSHTNRTQPTGYKMPDGFPTCVMFSSNSDIPIYEDTVKPIGMDGGEPIPTSTQFNVEVHTSEPRQLKKFDHITITGPYDPGKLSEFYAMLNLKQSITWWAPENSYVDFWGHVFKVEPSEHKEGEEPKLTLTIAVDNTDTQMNEVKPVFHDSAGT